MNYYYFSTTRLMLTENVTQIEFLLLSSPLQYQLVLKNIISVHIPNSRFRSKTYGYRVFDKGLWTEN